MCFYFDSIEEYEKHIKYTHLYSKDKYFLITSGNIGE